MRTDSVTESPVKKELVDVMRGPLLVAVGIGLAFEALAHQYQVVAVILVITAAASFVAYVRRGRGRYPVLHAFFTRAATSLKARIGLGPRRPKGHAQ
jgi:hypothetical protein